MAGRILDEIKQTKPFPSSREEALVSLMRTAAVLDHALGEALRPFGLTHTQYNVLRILRGAGEDGLCGREVGERLIARVPDVPRLLERMADQGLVRRDRDRSDRRHVTARLTEKGRRLLARATAQLASFGKVRFDALDERQTAELIELLDAIRAGS